MEPGPSCRLEGKTSAMNETPQTQGETGQRRRDWRGRRRAEVNEVHAKDTWRQRGHRPVAGRQAQPRASFPYAGQPVACL